MGEKESICHCDSQCQKVAIASLSVNGLKLIIASKMYIYLVLRSVDEGNLILCNLDGFKLHFV